MLMTNEIPQELIDNLRDPAWRISNLYKIIVKSSVDDSDDLVITFKPNRAQMRFIKKIWYRNVILKARQLGFTTLVSILWLDHALFNRNVRCGIVAQDREAAEVIFRDKVKFAYNNLPPILKENMPLARDSATELLFAHNNSSIRVATSMRSGTIHRLHVSEFGKICAKYPQKAAEVVTGSIPAVPVDGITIIESTAEGQEGEFYEMTQAALRLEQEGIVLSKKDYRMHFYAWWEAPEYVMPEESAVITDKDIQYFEKVEAEMNITLTPEQRAWYISTRDTDFSGSEEKMWQEYPSTPDEAFQQSTDGNWYINQMTMMRKQGRITNIPIVNKPVFTFWDIGNSDGCAIWFMQRVGFEYRMIDYFEAHGEDLTFYMKELKKKDYLIQENFLPHDATHVRLAIKNKSTVQMLKELGLKNVTVVPVTPYIQLGIQQTRDAFSSTWIDAERCKLGIQRLDNYKKKWNASDGRFSDTPAHDINAEGADAFRQFGQALALGMLEEKAKRAAPTQIYTPTYGDMGY
jgi:hypothetical protein